jgi:hypothetical protein
LPYNNQIIQLFFCANSAGAYLNFDLAFPSQGIPSDFFPSDPAVYGYSVNQFANSFLKKRADFFPPKDFGVWYITYESVSCSNWAGFKNAAALGSVAQLAEAACCPADPTPGNASNICPSFSDHNGLP